MPTRARFRVVKAEIRTLGVEILQPRRKGGGSGVILGAVCRGGGGLEGVLKARVRWGRGDLASKIVRTVKRSAHYGQIRVLLLFGPTLGGVRGVDGEGIARGLKRPVIIVEEGGKFRSFGIDPPDAEKIIERISMVALIPEPLRIARLIAEALRAQKI